MEATIKDLFRQASKLGQCGLFKGTETFGELISLLFSPQGVEFCQNNNFPDVDTALQFKKYGVDLHGVYINSGKVSITDAENVCLIGDTDAELTYSDPTKGHKVMLLHGAKARITATGYAVVFVYSGNGCEVWKETRDFAKIL